MLYPTLLWMRWAGLRM